MPNQLDERLKVLALAVKDEPFFNRVAFLIRQLIEERLDRGEFLNADAKESYSAAYKKKREERGLETDFVNLEFSGEMLGSLDHAFDADALALELGFNRDELARIASYHDVHGAGTNRVIREFLGLADDESERVHDFIMTELGAKFDFILESNLPDYP